MTCAPAAHGIRRIGRNTVHEIAVGGEESSGNGVGIMGMPGGRMDFLDMNP
jgi:hypothetical protein